MRGCLFSPDYLTQPAPASGQRRWDQSEATSSFEATNQIAASGRMLGLNMGGDQAAKWHTALRGKEAYYLAGTS